MKTGFELGLGLITAILMVYVFLVLLGIVLKKLSAWIERKEYEAMTPEQRVARKCFELSKALRQKR